MKIYVQARADGIITDALTFPYSNYVEVEVDSIPIGINGGWFKLIDGEIIEVTELKPIDTKSEIDQLRLEMARNNAELFETMLMLTGGL